MRNYLKPYLLTGVALLSVSGAKAIGYQKSHSGNKIVYQSENAGYSFELQSNREFVIDRAGTYKFTGKVSNSRIVVTADVTESVNIILDEVHIESDDTIIYSESDQKIKLSLFNRNILQLSGAHPVVKTNSPITINGLGSMLIKSDSGDGMDIQKDLSIEGGYLTIDTQRDGVIGINRLNILGGDAAIKAGNCAISTAVEIIRDGGQLELLS